MRERPIAKPSGTATASASTNPTLIRRIECKILINASGSLRMAGSSYKASCAGGRPAMPKTFAAISHNANRPKHANSGGKPGIAERRTLMAAPVGCPSDARSGSSRFDSVGRRAARPDGAVGEKHGLLYAVRDEQHGLAVALPDLEQLVLQSGARVRIKRTEWLIHE